MKNVSREINENTYGHKLRIYLASNELKIWLSVGVQRTKNKNMFAREQEQWGYYYDSLWIICNLTVLFFYSALVSRFTVISLAYFFSVTEEAAREIRSACEPLLYSVAAAVAAWDVALSVLFIADWFLTIIMGQKRWCWRRGASGMNRGKQDPGCFLLFPVLWLNRSSSALGSASPCCYCFCDVLFSHSLLYIP